MKYWQCVLYYRGKYHSLHKFTSREKAMEFYQLKLGAFKFGLVGWTVSYPSEVDFTKTKTYSLKNINQKSTEDFNRERLDELIGKIVKNIP